MNGAREGEKEGLGGRDQSLGWGVARRIRSWEQVTLEKELREGRVKR